MPSFNGFHKNKSGRINIPDVNTHILDQAPHGATALATANKLALRDVAGNFAVNFPVSGQNPNLLFNPSARLGLAGWSVFSGANWVFGFGSKGEGGYFQSPTVSNSFAILAGTLIPIAPSTQVTVSCEINTLGMSNSSAEIDCVVLDSAQTLITDAASPIVLNGNTWSPVKFTITTGANAAYLSIRPVINTGTGYAQFRKIKIEIGSIATTFSDDSTLNTVQYGNILPLAQILSGGNKVQSGTGPNITIATPGTPVTATVTFPVAFVTTPAVYGTLAGSYSDAGYVNLKIISVSTTGFTFQANSYLAQTLGTYWMAIGS